MSTISRRKDKTDVRASNLPVDRLQEFPIDAQNAELDAQRYPAPEVNRLKRKARWAAEMIEDSRLEGATNPWPAGTAVRFISIVSLCCWIAIIVGILLSSTF